LIRFGFIDAGCIPPFIVDAATIWDGAFEIDLGWTRGFFSFWFKGRSRRRRLISSAGA
jgi:hypothetical protein